MEQIFKEHPDQRTLLYNSIQRKLSDQSSLLRRLEIRYLLIDPTLVTAIFLALRTNQSLQELALTDGTLNCCDKSAIFGSIFKNLTMNPQNQLCMIDFSRNYKAVDNVSQTHVKILEGIKLINILPEDKKSKLERLILTIAKD